MLFQSWRFSIKRKFLAVVTIFLAAGLVSALLAVSIDIGDKMAKELNLQVMQPCLMNSVITQI